ncbi:predicted protein [Postia placenta Mad-698-R]|uniref:Uncharacterized protein n=1 Tax=Postia placenta MAD-698-R-SB12 TaxID=670580 RepID=A0A1X6N7U7_9APHY|nr:hypothetical protein POSPLADRAFT_1134617 [Postia placenta MAD-698-R-SB12]EED77572.1 predicted protein [Postia placenta Mad-698-R]OSX64708.1 hypothetical protein POSPLADRAFT_1134617 [Postia placenta MAD-698-R-SB12]
MHDAKIWSTSRMRSLGTESTTFVQKDRPILVPMVKDSLTGDTLCIRDIDDSYGRPGKNGCSGSTLNDEHDRRLAKRSRPDIETEGSKTLRDIGSKVQQDFSTGAHTQWMSQEEVAFDRLELLRTKTSSSISSFYGFSSQGGRHCVQSNMA